MTLTLNRAIRGRVRSEWTLGRHFSRGRSDGVFTPHCLSVCMHRWFPMATKRNQKNRVLFPFFLVAFTWQGRERLHARSTHAAGRAARARRPARTKVLRPPSLWLGSQLGDGDRARSKSWCDRSAQADRTQQPSSSVASGFVLFFPSSPRPRRFEFVTLLNSMNDGLHEGNQPGTKPFNGYKPALGCPSMHTVSQFSCCNVTRKTTPLLTIWTAH